MLCTLAIINKSFVQTHTGAQERGRKIQNGVHQSGNMRHARQAARFMSVCHAYAKSTTPPNSDTDCRSLSLSVSSPTLSHLTHSLLQVEGAPRHAAVINAKRKCSAKVKIKERKKKYTYILSDRVQRHKRMPHVRAAAKFVARKGGASRGCWPYTRIHAHTYIFQTWPTRHFASGPHL